MTDFATLPQPGGPRRVRDRRGSGIGADVVRAFAGNGAKVAFVDIQAEPARRSSPKLGDGRQRRRSSCRAT